MRAFRVRIEQTTAYDGVMVLCDDQQPSTTHPSKLAEFVGNEVNVMEVGRRTVLKSSVELIDGPADEGPEGM